MITIEIRTDGDKSYPVATFPDGTVMDRRHGSWLARCGSCYREPQALGVDPEDLQAHPDVKRFDRERKAALAAEQAS